MKGCATEESKRTRNERNRRRKRTSNKSKRSGGDTDMGAARNHCHRTRSAHSVHPQSQSQSPSQQHHDWGRHMLLTRATDIRYSGGGGSELGNRWKGPPSHTAKNVMTSTTRCCWKVVRWTSSLPKKTENPKTQNPKHTTVLSSFWFEPLRRLFSHKKLVPPNNVFCVWAPGHSGPRFKECFFSLWPQTHKRHTH